MAAPGVKVVDRKRALVYASETDPRGVQKCAELAEAGEHVPALRNLTYYVVGEVERAHVVFVFRTEQNAAQADKVVDDYTRYEGVEVFVSADASEPQQPQEPVPPESPPEPEPTPEPEHRAKRRA